MVIDSSAIVAILFNEPDASKYLSAIERAGEQHVSVASYLEAAIVIGNRGDTVARVAFEDLFREARITLQPVTIEQIHIAREAHRQFGKGRHPAALNFGDCFSYALAKAFDQPLLYKGDDFPQTDVASAIS
jgi:ribonuclease VapC